MKVERILLSNIVVPDERARSRFTDEQRAILRSSMERYGTVVFPIVRPLPDGRFELIDGESRIRTAQEAGIGEIDALVIPLEDRDASMMNLIANVARGEQDPISAAQALKKAQNSGLPPGEIAKIVNHTPQWVEFYISLLDLPDVYKQALEEGKLTVTHVRQACRLNDPREIDAALNTALSLSWPASTLEQYVERRSTELRGGKGTEKMPVPTTPPTPEQAVEMIRYDTCSGCGRPTRKEQLRLPPLCEECMTLLTYCTNQLGEPRQALNEIYQSVVHRRTFLEMQEKLKEMGIGQPQPGQTPSSSEKKEETSAT